MISGLVYQLCEIIALNSSNDFIFQEILCEKGTNCLWTDFYVRALGQKSDLCPLSEQLGIRWELSSAVLSLKPSWSMAVTLAHCVMWSGSTHRETGRNAALWGQLARGGTVKLWG